MHFLFLQLWSRLLASPSSVFDLWPTASLWKSFSNATGLSVYLLCCHKWITNSLSAYKENMFHTWKSACSHQFKQSVLSVKSTFCLSRVINYYVWSTVLNKPRIELFFAAVWTQPLLETVYSAVASIWPAQISTNTACGRLPRSSLIQCIILPDYVPYVRVLANEQTST